MVGHLQTTEGSWFKFDTFCLKKWAIQLLATWENTMGCRCKMHYIFWKTKNKKQINKQKTTTTTLARDERIHTHCSQYTELNKGRGQSHLPPGSWLSRMIWQLSINWVNLKKQVYQPCPLSVMKQTVEQMSHGNIMCVEFYFLCFILLKTFIKINIKRCQQLKIKKKYTDIHK